MANMHTESCMHPSCSAIMNNMHICTELLYLKLSTRDDSSLFGDKDNVAVLIGTDACKPCHQMPEQATLCVYTDAPLASDHLLNITQLICNG